MSKKKKKKPGNARLGEEKRGERREERERERESSGKKGICWWLLVPALCPARLAAVRKRRSASQARESVLFMAILILKWYLMSHQARTDLSELGYTAAGPDASLSHPTVLCRTCYCRTYSYVCFCASVLPLPGTPIPHRSTNDGVELPDGTPRGVRDLYPVWLPWFSAPPRSPSFSSFHASFLSLLLLSSGSNPLSAVRGSFVPHRRSRHRDVLRNKRLYPHARPTEKPPSSPTRATIIDGPFSLIISPFFGCFLCLLRCRSFFKVSRNFRLEFFRSGLLRFDRETGYK